jgi:multidrug resistance efflux pump
VKSDVPLFVYLLIARFQFLSQIFQAVKHAEEEKNIVREEKKRKAREERAKAVAEAQLKAQQIAYETAKLQAQQGGAVGAKSNTGLYVGLGLGGAVILGLVVYFAVKK